MLNRLLATSLLLFALLQLTKSYRFRTSNLEVPEEVEVPEEPYQRVWNPSHHRWLKREDSSFDVHQMVPWKRQGNPSTLDEMEASEGRENLERLAEEMSTTGDEQVPQSAIISSLLVIPPLSLQKSTQQKKKGMTQSKPSQLGITLQMQTVLDCFNRVCLQLLGLKFCINTKNDLFAQFETFSFDSLSVSFRDWTEMMKYKRWNALHLHHSIFAQSKT